ncbi:zinc transporter ZupT [Planctomycetes bacterium Pan216]|uniref:Zinc transporter ZupT n=1 Tax=Kolteria novifilia TaxID=2527975 RepID=A0A518B1X7_9BACT|nr:zinc transporter ZupT [Planctomycetes bacterium Pan216]
MSDRETLLVVATTIIWLSAIAGGLFALWLRGTKSAKRTLGLGNAAAGGIFLAIGLIHILPDASDGLSGVSRLMGGYPVAGLACSLGFLVLFSIERVVLSSAHHHDEPSTQSVVEGTEETAQPSWLFPLVLLTVLAFHSFMAGVALGLPEDLITAMVLTGAILAHKGSAAFALAVSMLRVGMPRGTIFILVMVFSLMTPLGVGGGYLLGELLQGSDVHAVSSMVLAFAAGTFLYIAAIDILHAEFAFPLDRYPKFLAVCLGFALTAAVAIWC